MKTLTELTAELQALFSGPEKWIKKTAARTKDQTPINYNHTNAFCFCLLGGIWRVQESHGARHRLEPLCRQAIVEIDPTECHCPAYVSVSVWQDSDERTFADIQKVLAKMAEIAARS